MTPKEQLDYLTSLDKETLDIIKSKSKDYAQDLDVLSNFKIVSQIVELSKIDVSKPEGYAMLMVILKIVRIWNLKSENKSPQNESLIDSYKDGINYFKLAFLSEIESLKESERINNLLNHAES